MKSILSSTCAALLLGVSAFAGETVRTDYKHTETPAPPCFADREWQVDLFGAYAFSSSSQDNLFGDHAWGGGLGVNYFFSRYVGLGLEGTLLDPRHGRDVMGQAGLNLFVRFPNDTTCLAPYIFLGGGAVFNAEELDADDFDRNNDDALWEGHAGVGLEYRFNPRFGVFADGRFTVVEKNDNNFTTIRTGFRLSF
jgi:opacity protein-like surface antigen